jgi:hypothetical protein
MFINAKFVLHFVSTIEKNERGNVQNLQLLEPARRDQFGDAIGTDQIFDVRIYNKDLLKLPDLMKIRLGSIIQCSLYLASKKVVITDGREFYQPYLTLKNIEVVKYAEAKENLNNETNPF